MVCLICYESLFKVQGSNGHIYYQESNFNEDFAERPAMLFCGHVYHKKCIEDWFLNSASSYVCPLCQRAPEYLSAVLYVDLEERDVEHLLFDSENDSYSENGGENEDTIDDLVNQIYFLARFCYRISSDQVTNIVQRVSQVTEKISENAKEMEVILEKVLLMNQKLKKLKTFLEKDNKRIGPIKDDLEKKSQRIGYIEKRSNSIQRILAEEK